MIQEPVTTISSSYQTLLQCTPLDASTSACNTAIGSSEFSPLLYSHPVYSSHMPSNTCQPYTICQVSPRSSHPIQVFIKTIRNQTILLQVDSISTILSLKHKIHELEGIPSNLQVLLNNNRLLNDNFFVSDTNLTDRCTVTCLLRVCGGMDSKNDNNDGSDSNMSSASSTTAAGVTDTNSKRSRKNQKSNPVDQAPYYTQHDDSSSIHQKFQFEVGRDIVPLFPTDLPAVDSNFWTFSISPPLPASLLMNPNTGMIIGRPRGTLELSQYEVAWGAFREKRKKNWSDVADRTLLQDGTIRISIQVRNVDDSIIEAKEECYEKSHTVIREILTGAVKLQSASMSTPKDITIRVSCGHGYHFETRSLEDCSNEDIEFLKSRLNLRGIRTFHDEKGMKIRVRLDDHLWQTYNESFVKICDVLDKNEALEAVNAHVRIALSDIVTPPFAVFVDETARKHFERYPYTASDDPGLIKFLKGSSQKTVKVIHLTTCSAEYDADDADRPAFCRFHLLDRHVQLSSVFVKDLPRYPIIQWDLTPLNQLVQNLFVFDDELREISEKVANFRNWVVHDNYDENFHDSFDWMKKLLNKILVESKTQKLELDEKILELEDHRARFKAFYPAKNSIEDFGRTESRLKVLTDDQWNLLKSIFDSSDPNLQLIEAPAGSGKTLIAIKLCVSKFIKRINYRILLLTHSRPLVKTVLIPCVQDELELNGHDIDAIDGVFKSNLNSSELHVTTIDDLIKNYDALLHLNSRDDLLHFIALPSAEKYDFIVIDEGHHVFSRQNNMDLEGQHLIPKEWVKDVIGWLLKPEYSQLSVFRDSIQAPKGDNEPCYPDNCEVKEDWIRHVIRNPGHVRDALVPLYSRIGTKLYDKTGLVKFYPMRDRRVKGPHVTIYEAENQSDYCSLLSKCLDDLLGQYGESIFSQTINEKEVSTIAILISSDCSDLIEDIKSRVSCTNQHDFIKNMISNSTSDACDTTRMYLGPFENFAGLERPFIIVIRDHDSTAYSCFSRCTFQLSVIYLGKFELYHLCEAEIGGEVSHSGINGKFVCLLSDSEAIVPLEIDLSKPLPLAYENAMGLRLFNITPLNILNPSFDYLRDCKKLKALDFSFSMNINTSDEDKYAIIDSIIGRLAISCSNLIYLNVSNNQFTTLPDSIGGLTSLKGLYASYNRLTTLPNWVGGLTSLNYLYVSNNQLMSLPDWIGGLTALNYLNVSNNQLMTLPDSIGGLTSLRHLYASNNQLTTLPDSIGGLTSLRHLDASNNQLTTLPASIGGLTSLTQLYASNNQLTSLPDSIGGLTSLSGLKVSNNQLTTLPDSIGGLTSLNGLDISNNRLVVLPDWIGGLTSLKVLEVSDNRLTSLPNSIGNLASLIYLNVIGNEVVEIPQDVLKLKQLKHLFICEEIPHAHHHG